MEPQCNRTGFLIRRGRDTRVQTQRNDHMKSQQEAGHLKGKEASEELRPANTLILNFQAPELRQNKFLLLKPSSLWYFVRVALANYDMWSIRVVAYDTLRLSTKSPAGLCSSTLKECQSSQMSLRTPSALRPTQLRNLANVFIGRLALSWSPLLSLNVSFQLYVKTRISAGFSVYQLPPCV